MSRILRGTQQEHKGVWEHKYFESRELIMGGGCINTLKVNEVIMNISYTSGGKALLLSFLYLFTLFIDVTLDTRLVVQFLLVSVTIDL